MRELPQNTQPSSKRTQPWVLERMVHRAQPHLGEVSGSSLAPGLIVAAIILLTIVVGLLLFFWVGQALGPKAPPSNLPASGPLSPVSLTATRASATAVPRTATATAIPPSPTRGRTTYQVKPGDTLLGIAYKYGVSVQAIINANGLKSDTIRIGDELVIPLPTPTPH